MNAITLQSFIHLGRMGGERGRSSMKSQMKSQMKSKMKSKIKSKIGLFAPSVLIFALTLLGNPLARASHPNTLPPPPTEWFECSRDKDCKVFIGSCGEVQAYNKRFKNDLKRWLSEAGKCKPDSMGKSNYGNRLGARSACQTGQCGLIVPQPQQKLSTQPNS